MATSDSDDNRSASQRASVPSNKGIELILRQIKQSQELERFGHFLDEVYESWKTTTENFLRKAFGDNAPELERFQEAGGISVVPGNADGTWWEAAGRARLKSKIACLGSCVEILRADQELLPEEGAEMRGSQIEPLSRKVFVVHGHDEAIRETCARFLEKLALQPIILHEKPNEGRTIIEKFQAYSDVSFAVVLLTGDDKGGTQDVDPSALKPRARQNVIFELGFFIGKLGRSRVCALYEEGVELPSDYSGVLFTPLDPKGAWRFGVAREIKAAGIDVDLNKAT